MGAGCSRGAKMSVGQTGRALALEHDGALAGGGAQSQLVEGQDFTSSFKDTLTGLGGDVKSSNRQLRDVEQPQVVGDGSNATAILSCRPSFFMCRTREARDSGGRCMRDINSRFKTMPLNLASVLRAKKR